MIYPLHREKRQIPRTKISTLVSCHIFDAQQSFKKKDIEAITVDLNELGVTLITDREIAIGSRLVITFHLMRTPHNHKNPHYRTITFSGKIIHLSEYGRNLVRMGVMFNKNDNRRETKFFDIICSETRGPAEFLFNHLSYE
jgi:hypothetical protein